MKSQASLLFLVLISAHVFGQAEKILESKISDVTVFLSKAQVTRMAKSKLEEGKTNLIITGLPSQIDPESIQVAGKGSFVVSGISHRHNFLNELNTPKALRLLKDSVDYMQRQILLEQSQKEILSKEEQMLLSNQKIGGINQNLTVAELKAMADFYRSRLGEIVIARMKQDEKIKKLNARTVKMQQQMNEQNELYTRNTSEIVVSVSADADGSAEFEINYVVTNAGWYPVYDLRAINTKKPIQLNYKANVFQGTGEEWKNVRLKLSTANPDLGGLKPELSPWYLDFYYPIAQALRGKVSGVMVAPAAEIEVEEMVEDKEMAPVAESVADYVQTIQTTLNTEFDISLPSTVISSSKPTLVDIRNYEMKAIYSYSTAPRMDADVFLIAKATGWEEFNLLPGEANIFFEGTYVGKTGINPNTIKDTLAVSLGRDKRIVVKREKLKDLASRKLIGASQKESYAYELSVRNTKQEAIQVTVEDQVPVSQNSQIEIVVLETAGAKYTKDNGILTWELTLQPNETKKMVYQYEVKYPKGKQVSGL